jgi:hypothetical protein
MLKRPARFALLAACCAFAAAGALAQTPPAEQKEAPAPSAEELKKQEREQARLQAEKEAKARRQELEAKCQIKPVMSDEDIENCRVAYPVK